jgi:hypothetical protein
LCSADRPHVLLGQAARVYDELGFGALAASDVHHGQDGSMVGSWRTSALGGVVVEGRCGPGGVRGDVALGDLPDKRPADEDVVDELDGLLHVVATALYEAALVDDDNELTEIGHSCHPRGPDDLGTYSDGRPVMKTVDVDEGTVEHVWHPNPLNAENLSQVFVEEQELGWGTVMITEWGRGHLVLHQLIASGCAMAISQCR